jgi:hypothetical protein
MALGAGFLIDPERPLGCNTCMMLKTLRRILAGFLFATLPLALSGAVKPAPLFSDNMVLQAGQPVPVWGWADDGEVVTIKFRNQKISTTARNLAWHLKLGKLKAGGPDVFTLSTKTDTIQFTNVLVGDVWVCSGQSNMEWPMSRSFEPAADIASATNAMIRVCDLRRGSQVRLGPGGKSAAARWSSAVRTLPARSRCGTAGQIFRS